MGEWFWQGLDRCSDWVSNNFNVSAGSTFSSQSGEHFPISFRVGKIHRSAVQKFMKAGFSRPDGIILLSFACYLLICLHSY